MKPATTLKKFISQSSGKVSAEAFLKAHYEFLILGELSILVEPIFQRLEKKEVMPTAALNEIRKIAFDFFVESEANKIIAKETSKKTKNTKSTSKKMYSAVIYTASGNIATFIDNEGNEKDLVFNTDNPLQAESWCNRKLFDLPNCYGKVVNKVTGFTNEISRDSAIAAILRTGPIGAYKKTGSDGKSWKMKAKGDHFHFSHG